MSWILFILGAFVLLGGVRSQPVFGMTPDEAGMALGCSLWLLAFVAWVVERFTDRGRVVNERELVLDVLAILKSHVTDPFLMGQIARAEDDIEPYVPRSTAGPGPESWLPGAPVPCPTDSGDPVQGRDLPAAPPEVGDDPAGSDGSTATLGAAVGTGESPAPSSWSFIVGAHHDVHEDRSRSIGVEDHSAFPVGEWTRLYVPTARLNECIAALDALSDSEAHAPDPGRGSREVPTQSPTEDESIHPTSGDLDDVVWVRSTGRGMHDVMAASSPTPVVLASVMFTEGVKGRTLALERFAAALGSVSQDVVTR